jgi:hypothetical protein
MTEVPFELRLAAAGLTLSEAEKPKLAELVKEIDRAAAMVRSAERSYLDEPSNVFRLVPPG